MKRNNTGFEEVNLFEEIGDLVIQPLNSFCNIVDAAFEGELPDKKDVATILGAVASLWLITRIF